jgi:hypothetical protein
MQTSPPQPCASGGKTLAELVEIADAPAMEGLTTPSIAIKIVPTIGKTIFFIFCS